MIPCNQVKVDITQNTHKFLMELLIQSILYKLVFIHLQIAYKWLKCKIQVIRNISILHYKDITMAL